MTDQDQEQKEQADAEFQAKAVNLAATMMRCVPDGTGWDIVFQASLYLATTVHAHAGGGKEFRAFIAQRMREVGAEIESNAPTEPLTSPAVTH